jgi:hypothetical protein
MSLYVSNPIKILTYAAQNLQQLFLSTTYALTGENIFLEYENPIITTLDTSLLLQTYYTDFGDGSDIEVSSPSQQLSHAYNQTGVFYISFSAVYSDSSIQTYTLQNPLIIQSKWSVYDQTKIRLTSDVSLTLPYTLEQINIQPNEWGVADIFNTSILRLQENLDYLKNNTQTINIHSPISYNGITTGYFGWMGNDSGVGSSIIKWYTLNCNNASYNHPEYAKSSGSTYFFDIRDAIQTEKFIHVLDGTLFRTFSGYGIPIEIPVENSFGLSQLINNPLSFTVDETGTNFYITDPPSNKIIKYSITLSSQTSGLVLNIQNAVGSYGGLTETNKFNSPTEIVYNNSQVYVLDYNNYCIKRFNSNLSWIYTYTSDYLINDHPVGIAVQPDTDLLYVITESYKIYIFDSLSSEVFEILDVSIAKTQDEFVKIHFNQTGDFFYLVTKQNIFKFSTTGNYISQLEIPKTTDVTFTNVKNGPNNSILISSPLCLIKCQDILEIFRLGNGIPYKYWTPEQLSVQSNEFSSDFNYNRSLNRISENVIQFKNTLNSKFVIVNENTAIGTLKYFSWVPVTYKDLPTLDFALDDTYPTYKIGIGVNELHSPQVINRELGKIYNSINSVKNFLNIENYDITNSECLSSFCWSWKSTSCYNYNIPILKTCNINPISLYELSSNMLAGYGSTLNKTWESAISNCCNT